MSSIVQRAVAVGALCALLSCSATSEPPGTDEPKGPNLPLQDDGSVDVSGGAWRMIDVPAASNAPTIVRTPDGFFALSSRSLGADAKVITGFENALYRSTDGVSWRSVPLDAGGDADGGLQLSSLAYGAGRFVMVGRDTGEGVVWSSRDAQHWTQAPQGVDSTSVWRDVVFVHERFIALGFPLLGVSTDGEHFELAPIELVQPTSAAYGNGRYLIVGSGPMEVSSDGVHWQAHDVNCLLKDACIKDPSGGVHQGIESHVVFAEGRFFTDQLSSEDGVAWNAEPGRFPAVHASGHFLDDGGYDLHAWTTGSALQSLPVIRTVEASVTQQGRALTSVGVLDHDAELPERVDVGFDDGLTCETATCVIIGSRLYLVPPPGTAPLPDRVPRSANGAPLLSDDCPRSSMVFCDDYDRRIGCHCRPRAPSGPEACEDVSQYGCESIFTPTDDEWHVAEVAEGGCSCNAVDPHQPPTFGKDCSEDTNVCRAPFSCLSVQQPPSFGPAPLPRMLCTASCTSDADCPSWEATGFCAGHVMLSCADGVCQPRSCE